MVQGVSRTVYQVAMNSCRFLHLPLPYAVLCRRNPPALSAESAGPTPLDEQACPCFLSAHISLTLLAGRLQPLVITGQAARPGPLAGLAQQLDELLAGRPAPSSSAGQPPPTPNPLQRPPRRPRARVALHRPLRHHRRPGAGAAVGDRRRLPVSSTARRSTSTGATSTCTQQHRPGRPPPARPRGPPLARRLDRLLGLVEVLRRWPSGLAGRGRARAASQRAPSRSPCAPPQVALNARRRRASQLARSVVASAGEVLLRPAETSPAWWRTFWPGCRPRPPRQRSAEPATTR